MMELGEYYCMNQLLVQFLNDLVGTLRNSNQLELVLK
jgi:hypothetical protein